MRERTRIELTELCVNYFAATGDDQQAARDALYERAPFGNYYIRNEKGVPVYVLDVEEGAIGVSKADAEDRKNRKH